MSRKKRSLLSFLGFAASTALALNRLRRDTDKTSYRALGPSSEPAQKISKEVGSAAGKDADTPAEIPPKGWLEVAKRTAKKFSDNELMSEAASVTFFALLALFPAITAIVSIYGLFADRSAIQAHLEDLSTLLPSGGMEIISEQVKRLTQSPASGLGVGAIIGILTALWSSNQGTKAMFSALNVVYGEHETRGFVKMTATSLIFTLGGILFLLLGLASIVVVPLVFHFFGLSSALDLGLRVGRWPLMLIALVVLLSVLYRYGPSRRHPRWQWVTWGGAFAALAWVGLSLGFSWYVANFGNYNKTYGSLGAVIGFMTWMWLSSTVLLLGAQLNAELETQTGRDSTVGAAKPRGTRGAAAADSMAATR